jgi:hypothetical protein
MYYVVKVLRTVSPFGPSFSPEPNVYPTLPIPLLAQPTTYHSQPTFHRPFFSNTYELPLPTHRFADPLFSDTYELLFPQPLCFDNHLRCPLFFLSPLPFPTLVSSANSVGEQLPNSFACHTYQKCAKISFYAVCKSFRCHTYKNASPKSFPCHTYKKRGVGW